MDKTLRPTNLHVLHGIFKQHQVHRRVELIVVVYHFSKNCLQPFPVFHWHVTWVFLTMGKVAINKRLLHQHTIVSTLQENEGQTVMRATYLGRDLSKRPTCASRSVHE